MNHDHHHPDTHFDERAATWDEDGEHRERAAAVVAAIAERVDLRPDTSVLEYGAGTGLVAQGLSPRVGALTLVDTSAGMREVMAAKVAAGVLPARTRIWDVDLTGEREPQMDETFDLVVAVMVLHHLTDIPRALARFADLLSAGGTLCIADLDSEDGSYHSSDLAVQHGFDRAELAAQLSTVGLTHVQFSDGPARERDGRRYTTFVALASQR